VLRLSVSPLGVAALVEAWSAYLGRVANAFDDLTAEERTTTAAALRSLMDALVARELTPTRVRSGVGSVAALSGLERHAAARNGGPRADRP
jgi:hypothetical protein